MPGLGRIGCLCQEKVDDKWNEISAIPLIIKQLGLADAVITIDVIGCQTAIAEQGDHYLLTVKGNQGDLLDEVACAFKACPAESSVASWGRGRHRFDPRPGSILSAQSRVDSQFLATWPGLSTLVKVVSSRLLSDKKIEETRYYIREN